MSAADVTRKQYRELSDSDKANILRIKQAGDALLEAIDECAIDPRSIALARTNCEQAVMWAVKGASA